ncbi:hypothetical protein E1A91_D10G051400v1 [Gossypium mustelinum]|uniref:Uncharacterized protein n=1 Tax=Gossypium mustelinum TaxID=34275 RepID=A0A5D2T2X2_GOSMU|nr:hypothetical protein E1A91_D10G051400v1 [Gossypium mustelinum]
MICLLELYSFIGMVSTSDHLAASITHSPTKDNSFLSSYLWIQL